MKALISENEGLFKQVECIVTRIKLLVGEISPG